MSNHSDSNSTTATIGGGHPYADLCPAGCTAAIIAEHIEDRSDSQSDYYGSTTTRRVIIGWLRGKRFDFRQVRRAAATFPETAHLGPDASDKVEHRENWSMGGGNYVKDGWRHSTGWKVSTTTYLYKTDTYELHLPEPTSAAAADPAPAAVERPTMTINPERQGVELRFPAKPNAALLADLKATGWRWSRFSKCWYTADNPARRLQACQIVNAMLRFDASPEALAEFHARQETTPAETATSPTTTATTTTTDKIERIAVGFESAAERVAKKIDHGRRPMTQNPTPKRMREYRSRLHEADNLDRYRRLILALAAAHRAGTVPPELAGFLPNFADARVLAQLVEIPRDHGREGYYDVFPAADYRQTDRIARAAQKMIEPGAAEADARREASEIAAAEAATVLHDTPSFFPTPRPLAKRLVDMAHLAPGAVVLEPSAGSGHIADAVRDACPDANITCHEIDGTLRTLLLRKGHCTLQGDFLEHEPDPAHLYDAVLMNPPFNRGADIQHILHAWKFVAPGGRLVAIISAGYQTANRLPAEKLRRLLEREQSQVEQLPDDWCQGPDAVHQTSVRAVIVHLRKPAANGDWHAIYPEIVRARQAAATTEEPEASPAPNAHPGGPLTADERWILQHWSMFGSDGYPIQKLQGNRWIVVGQRDRGGCPTVFRTKTAAVEQWESFIRLLLDRNQAAAPPATADHDTTATPAAADPVPVFTLHATTSRKQLALF